MLQYTLKNILNHLQTHHGQENVLAMMIPSMKLQRINYRDVNSINNTDKSKHQSDPVEEIKEVSKDYKMEIFQNSKRKLLQKNSP